MSKDLKIFMFVLTHNVLNLQSSSSPYSDKLLDNSFCLAIQWSIIDLRVAPHLL